MKRSCARRGFTLVELVIAMLVLAILLAIAYPTYQSIMRKSRRAGGMSALSQVMQAQERYRANNSTYYVGGMSGLLPGSTPEVSSDGYYTLSVSAGNADGTASRTGYVASATARSGTVQSDDTQCHVLRVTVDSGNTAYSSLDSSNQLNDPDPCWTK